MNFPIITTNNSPSNPSFQARTPAVRYTSLRKIKDVPCACCGRRVIVSDVFSSVYSAISRPLESVLKDNDSPLNIWRGNPLVWNLLQKFMQDNPKKSLDKIIQDKKNMDLLNEVLNAVAEKDVKRGKSEDRSKAQSNVYHDLIHKSRATMRSSSVVIKRLASLKKYIEGIQLEVFEQLEIYSRKYPRKTLTEIINMPEVYKFHSLKDSLQRTETEEKINFRFENIRELVKKTNPDAVEYFDSLKDRSLFIFAKIKDPKIRMMEIKRLYQKALANYNCEELIPKVHKEIDNMPTTYNTKDSFFVYASEHDYNDSQIVNSIFGPAASTFEHVVPRSASGEDRIDNGLVLHWACNQIRGSIPYEKFFEYHPEMPKNIQRQVNYIARKILNGSLGEGFSFWPMNISNTLYRYTNGLVSLDVTKYCEKGLKLIQEKIETRSSLIDELKDDYDTKLIQRLELQKQLAELDSDLDSLKTRSRDLEEQNKDDAKLKSSYKKHIKLQKRKKSKPE